MSATTLNAPTQARRNTGSAPCLAVIVLTGALTGCATSGTHLDIIESQQRHALYKSCVAAQTKASSFGSGLATHEACLAWARRQI